MFIFYWSFKIIFKILGWKIVSYIPKNITKGVLIVAPHTSNWDAFYGLGTMFIYRIRTKFAIKRAALFFPLGFILKKLGAVAIDRDSQSEHSHRGKDTVKTLADLFEKEKSLILVIAPEGTRKYVKRWRTGFYHIALHANVPIIPGFIDYAKKEVGVGPIFYPTGNIDQDIKELMSFYLDKSGKYPENEVRLK